MSSQENESPGHILSSTTTMIGEITEKTKNTIASVPTIITPTITTTSTTTVTITTSTSITFVPFNSPLSPILEAIHSNDDRIKRSAVKLLNKIFSNILKHPKEVKYRSLKIAKVQPKLVRAKGGLQFLKFSGFIRDEGGLLYVLPPHSDLGKLQLCQNETAFILDPTKEINRDTRANQSEPSTHPSKKARKQSGSKKECKNKTSIEPAVAKCSQCGDSGHMFLRCPFRLDAMKERCPCGSRQHDKHNHLCQNCGGRGHLQNNCPVVPVVQYRRSSSYGFFSRRRPHRLEMDDRFDHMSYEEILHLEEKNGKSLCWAYAQRTPRLTSHDL